ncbi:MAG: ATP-binding cassette domain-containing protein [Candidatus Liptonbacteria bacterium]|nr:ATP-binding cassette domain-containing protein [Candidatus Liptonbacteria bacterium]
MEKVVEVKNLKKVFSFGVKDPNKGFLKNLFTPEIKSITAVDNISFSINEGESLAFIGPNGAGKSTTIKMLTGILWPSSGQIEVLGFNPQEDRKRLALNVGTVFGQRSQLLFNLPIIDSLELFAKVYEVEKTAYEKQKNKLIEIFDLSGILNQPVRKLSLGQRMRAEISAALIHEPPIIFLDEPTIGLDIVAKRRLRENLRSINKEFKTTIFLTSHDAGDIETVCARTIIINHGKVIFDGSTDNLKTQYLNQKVVRVVLDDDKKVDVSSHINAIAFIKNTKGEAIFTVDTDKTSIDEVLKDIIHGVSVEDITIEDPPLEEIISRIYETQTS